MVTKRRRKVTKEEIKTEEKDLRDYELVFIVRPDIAEDSLDTVVEKVNRIIKTKGGTVSETERWGKRKLAYPIKHHMEGYYVLSRFKNDPAASKEIESNLQIAEELIRYMIIKKE